MLSGVSAAACAQPANEKVTGVESCLRLARTAAEICYDPRIGAVVSSDCLNARRMARECLEHTPPGMPAGSAPSETPAGHRLARQIHRSGSAKNAQCNRLARQVHWNSSVGKARCNRLARRTDCSSFAKLTRAIRRYPVKTTDYKLGRKRNDLTRRLHPLDHRGIAFTVQREECAKHSRYSM